MKQIKAISFDDNPRYMWSQSWKLDIDGEQYTYEVWSTPNMDGDAWYDSEGRPINDPLVGEEYEHELFQEWLNTIQEAYMDAAWVSKISTLRDECVRKACDIEPFDLTLQVEDDNMPTTV